VEGRVKCLLRTEAGDIGFNKALALENAKGGITVNAICPGATSYRNGAGGAEGNPAEEHPTADPG